MGNTKITPEQEKEILKLYSKGYNMQEIASIFGVSAPTIGNIVYMIARPRGFRRREEGGAK